MRESFVSTIAIRGQTMLITWYLINLRKRLTDAEMSKQRLKVGLQHSLQTAESTSQNLREKLYKTEQDYKNLEKELKRKAEENVERRRIQTEEEKQRLVEKEGREKTESENLERIEGERLHLENQLLQSAEEKKYLADELQKATEGCRRIEEEWRKLQEAEQRWLAERQVRDRELKEINEKLEAQRREFEESIHEANRERNYLKETIREMVKSGEDFRGKHAKEEQGWKSEIEKRDKIQKEIVEKFDIERRDLEERLLKAEEKLKSFEEETKLQKEEEEERRRGQAEEEQRRRAEGEEISKAQKGIIDQLEAECQQLKERLSKSDEERKYLEKELKRTAEVGPEGSGIEKFVQLGAEREQLEERLSKSEKKRKRLITKLRKIKAINRGGHPRGSIKNTGDNGSQKQRIRHLKPEIICWKQGWNWIIGIEVPEGLEAQSVSQNGIQLECDFETGKGYPLKQVESKVEIIWSGGTENIGLFVPERNHLIFKMRNNWRGPGRLVRYSTMGYYLIIVPQDWERDIEISGSASVTPESTQFEKFKAHFFYQEKAEIEAIGFITPDGKRTRVESRNPRFRLVGNEICDASEDKGPLFAKHPPLIQALDGGKGWSDVGVIIVGEEGKGKNRWRDSFVPQVGVQEQAMLNELLNERSGWYYLRIYDKDNDLIESMDFRFSKNLEGIKIEGGMSYFPDLNGYENTIVRFLHHPDCKFELIDKDKEHLLEILRENDQTSVTVPPNPNCDKTNWILNDCGVEIEVSILVERIWWSCSTLEGMPTIWMDKPAQLFRKDFIATTNKALWVRLPRPLFVRNIYGGFDRAKSRFYQVEVERKEVPIPLRDFCDCEEILNPKQEYLFQLFIDSPNKAESTPVIRIITASSCKYCQFITSSEQGVLSHISSHVRELIKHLTYEELWHRSGGSLPRIIYRCAYCPFYVKTDDIENPTSGICNHIEQKHVKAKIYFSIVADIDEIRENVLTNLPHIYRCEICRREFHGNDRESMLEHLVITHKDKLFKCL